MSKLSPRNISSTHQPIGVLSKIITTSGFVLFIFNAFFLFNHNQFIYQFRSLHVIKRQNQSNSNNYNINTSSNTNSQNQIPPTNLSHIGFVVMSSLPSWKPRKAYIEAWWRPNVTRGYVFLDSEPTPDFFPWPDTSPPFHLNEDVSKLGFPPEAFTQVRMFRTTLDMLRVGELEDLRWIVMADDDTFLLVDNLVEVLGKYDHTKYYHIGTNSECVLSNADFSFDMGFGGAGYALSYPLFQAFSKQLDSCLRRYFGIIHAASHMVQACMVDMGVALSIEKGFHQIDLHRDLWGFLSAHPQSPFISLHHFETVEPIFPRMDRAEAVHHLMKAAKHDQSRVMQQTICYRRQTNWSFSVAWGYSAQIYENVIPRSILRKPLETFTPWLDIATPPFYMFNTRILNANPCEAPHVFFFKSIKSSSSGSKLITIYSRAWRRKLPPCFISGNNSADFISEIRVSSPAFIRKKAEVVECCDVDYKPKSRVAKIKLRSCMKDEVLA